MRTIRTYVRVMTSLLATATLVLAIGSIIEGKLGEAALYGFLFLGACLTRWEMIEG
ncbi:MAG: hypothetical protein WC862_03050 [Patescibacteria group bacterium]